MSQLKKYRKVKYLGKGSYGAAILVELRADPSKKFVIKEIVIGHLKPEEQQSAKNEAEVLHQMNHSNITMYIESFVENSKLYIVMEHADGGDLSSAVQKRKSEGKYWAEEELMRIFVQICLALKHVHDQNILHRDLKSQNIFLTQKGMVKLGDFGIAKVLDASEDQARTQIGTPYYLSPEICESQPYGRKSDVWSLGVILYELLALEMPFQAQSLPALVHKIVSQEPSYAQVEARYSGKLLSLCRTLLQKNPDLRPTVAQIVKNDYIKEHISRLLSYTLKAGNGGVLSDIPPRPSEVVRLDPEEADRRMELAREKERDLLRQNTDSKEVQMERERQVALAKKEEEKEKLRKFREDMARKRRDVDAKETGYSGRDRSRSPVGSRQGGDRSRSPIGNRSQVSRERSRSPISRTNSNNRGGPSGANNVQVTAAPPRATNNSNSSNPYQRHNGARSPNGPSAMAQGQVAYRGRSLADLQAQRQQDAYQSANSRQNNGYMVPATNASAGGGGGGGYEDAARREYFASRAAAQAVKAKIEALDRQGSNANQMLTSYDNNSNNNANSNNNYPQRRPSNGGDNYADMDPEKRIAMIKAQREREKQQEIALKEQQMKMAIEQNREERRRFEMMRQQHQEEDHFDHNSNNNNNKAAGSDAVTRRSKGSIAFDIDLRSDVNDVVVTKRSNVKQSRWSLDRDEPAAVASVSAAAAPRRLSQGNSSNTPPVMALPVVAESNNNNRAVAAPSSNRKGWGPPVDAKDILQAYNRKPSIDASSSPAPSTFAALEDDDNNEVDEDMVATTKAGGRGGGAQQAVAEGEDVVLKRLENKRQSDMAMREQALEVMAKLREKKLREAKLKKAQQKYGGAGGAVADAKQYPVVSPLKKGPSVTVHSHSNANRAQSPKLMEVLNSIDAAREFVGNVAAQRRLQTNVSPIRGGGDAKRSRLVEYEDEEEVRRVRALEEKEQVVEDDFDVTVNRVARHNNNNNNEDDLDTNLATWLLEQKRSVTMRKKTGGLSANNTLVSGHQQYQQQQQQEDKTGERERTYMSVDAQAETVRDDDDLDFYASQRQQTKGRIIGGPAPSSSSQYEDELFEDYANMTIEDRPSLGNVAVSIEGSMGGGGGDGQGSYYDMHRPLRAKFANGEDADVIGMQCMLAQALIDDDLNNGSKYDDDDN